MKIWSILLLVLIQSCTIDREMSSLSANENLVLAEFQNLDPAHKVHICEATDSTEKLMLCLTFVDIVTKEILPQYKIQFYHADENGEYHQTDPNDDTTAKLQGTGTTNSKGEIYVETILPGDYGRSEDNRHIHTTVYDGRVQAYDIHFKQYTGYMGTRFSKRSFQHFLADLKINTNGDLVTFLTIDVKSFENN